MTDTALKLQLDRIEGKLDTLLKRSNRWSTKKQEPVPTMNSSAERDKWRRNAERVKELRPSSD